MLYALAYFTPSEFAVYHLMSTKVNILIVAIVQGLGYRGTAIQLNSVPPYVCSTFVALVACWTGDSLRHRGLFVVGAGCVSIIGYAMYLTSTNTRVLYASLFLQVIGAYSVAPLQSTWMREWLVSRLTGGPGLAGRNSHLQ
jgi:hypothetical protein